MKNIDNNGASATTLTLTYIDKVMTLSNQKVLVVAHRLLKNLLTKEIDPTIGAHTQNIERLCRTRNESGNTMLWYIPL